MKDICKAFFGVPVLDHVDFEVEKGEIHALIGENGAGKSTLMKILAGVYRPDNGEIFLDEKRVNIANPKDGMRKHISFIHQELSMVPEMTIAQNFFLGEELIRNGMLDHKLMNERAVNVLSSFGLNFGPDMTVDTLSVAQQQMVEICRAISFDAKIIIMDEPTASLSNNEVENLFRQIRRLQSEGVTIIYISHKFDELMEICDNVTVLRDGRFIARKCISETTQYELISLMVGREIGQMYAAKENRTGEIIFEVKNLRNRYLKGISFSLKRGEILGISGLVGAGRTELAHAIFGIDRLDEGKMYLSSKYVTHRSPSDAIKNGFALVPEDRKKNGLVLIQDVNFNIMLCIMKQIRNFFRIFKLKEKFILGKYVNSMSIKMNSAEQICMSLSGGNQQKVVISKWMATQPKIIILDEPTRGIDIGAKSEIYSIIYKMVASGVSVIMISSELPEIMNLSDRVLVMHEGALMKIIDADGEEFTPERIAYYAMGGE
jgi:ribose transport system ATP-binding protein/inositol transport system ATP-binding protein